MPESMVPLISTIMPVYNGLATLERAVNSVCHQTLGLWELLVVDDCSTDGSGEFLRSSSLRDDRIKFMRTPENLGPSSARNIGLNSASGRMITYLDCDDEFYPNYFQLVDHFSSKGDVLVFSYDYLEDHGERAGKVRTWHPERLRQLLFSMNCSTPLGIAHKRTLYETTRGFDDLLWCLEDWELWKRLARTGAEFLFLPERSGLYHIREHSRSRAPRVTDRQKAALSANHNANRPLYAPPSGTRARLVKRVLLASSHSLLDSSPTSFSMLAILELLITEGLACEAFSLVGLESEDEADLETCLTANNLKFRPFMVSLGPFIAKGFFALHQNLPITFFLKSSVSAPSMPGDHDTAPLAFFEKTLDAFQPDVLLTDRASGLNSGMIELAKRRDMTVVVMTDPSPHRKPFLPTHYKNVDFCLATTEFTARTFWESFGLHCQVLPSPFGTLEVRPGRGDRKHVAILTSNGAGDVLFATKVEEKLGLVRPDISVVVVGPDRRRRTPSFSRSRSNLEEAGGLERSRVCHEWFSLAKIIVVPSLSTGIHDRRAAEAMIHGIPTVVSERGALPELVGEAGLVLEIPSHFQPGSMDVPKSDDISDWVATIARLWDDREFYDRVSAKTLVQSERWHPHRTAPVYAAFFRGLSPQPGPPFVPKWCEGASAGSRVSKIGVT